jgi:hypothetical protein
MGAEGVADTRSTSLRITGLTEAIAAYDALYGDLLELQPIPQEGAATMALASRLHVQSDTYALAGSISSFATGATAEVMSTSVYAEVQQWGWPARNIPAQGYLQEAIAGSWPTVQRKAEAKVQAMVDAIGGGE